MFIREGCRLKPEIYPIPIDGPGGLFIMPMPRADRLSTDIRAFRDLGVDQMISLLEPAEARSLSLSGEGNACAAYGIDYLNFPIADLNLPDPDRFDILVRHVIRLLNSGKRVAVHCRAGIGRSGMLTSCVVANYIGSGSEAIAHVSKARGALIPDTEAQRDFILDFTKSIGPDKNPG